MKKKIGILLAIGLLLTGCNGNTIVKIDITKFDDVMNNRGFFVTDQTETLSNENVTAAHVAYDSSYELNFITCNTTETCQSMFSSNKETILNQDGEVSVEEEKTGDNYQVYKAFIGDRYYVLVQVEDTFLYVDVYRSYNYEIKNIVEELGY